MKRILTALAVVGSLAVATVATSGPALAWRGGWGGYHGGGWGWGGPALGFAAGALVGGALAAPYAGYGYYPYGGYYGYAAAPYPYYGPSCAWRSVWNGYTWVRACI
jgi:hypothetical protein